MKRELCNNTMVFRGGNREDSWAHCAVCGGRVHEPGCTGKKIKGRDCPGQEYHTPEEMFKAGYGPIEQHAPAKTAAQMKGEE